jgi:3-oxoacyl-[acyl-carrier protein] reductase
VKHFGTVDILVNNAGITKDSLILRMKEEDFDNVINTNLKGTFNCVKHVTPIMLKQKSGKIINISSVIGIVGNAGQVNYAAAKAGIIGLTKATAKELASRGITVNAVAPGFIKSEMTDILSDKVTEAILNTIPLKRLGTTEDVANITAFLASPEADYVTGQVINVDGGMVM